MAARHRIVRFRAFRAAAVGLLTLALSAPAGAQGKSQQSHGKNGQGKPSESVLPAASAGGGSAASPAATASPFAWIDNASLMPAGMVWVGFSVTRWQGGGLSEVDVPVVDVVVGLTPRVQFGASVPRVSGSGDPADPGGSIGTTFFNAKIAAYRDDARGISVAVAPTIEVLSQAAAAVTSDGGSRTQFGLPVSVDAERDFAHVYGSVGYFSPGIWFAGAGAARRLTDRLGVGISFSHAWASSGVEDPAVEGPSRNDLSGGVSLDLTPHIGIFGSIGRTLGTSAEQGAGTTVSIGLSLTAGPMNFIE